jgi:GH18 family chitinase
MKKLNLKFESIVLLLLLLFSQNISAQQYDKLVVAGFYPYTKDYILKPESIQLQSLTHLIYCFAGPRADGSISTETGSYHNPSLVSRTHAAGKKFIIMMGGGLQSGGYHDMTSSAATRTIFINTLVEWCKTYGYDGVNIDWEYPGDNNRNEDRQNLTSLISEMRQAFNNAQVQLGKRLEISIDVHSSLYYAQWVDFASIKSSIDWFGLMSYDYSGDWAYSIHAAHNAPLYCGPQEICDRYLCVDRGVKNLTDSLNIPSSQIVMGLAMYGREFYNNALYQTPREGGGGVAYYDIKPLIGNGYTRYWDDQSKVPYLLKTSGSGFISYDDEQSLTEKSNYIKQKQLLGAMMWEITQDVDKVTKQQPLLTLIGQQLVGVDLDTKGKPTVSITSPTNNFVFIPNSNLSIAANAQVETGYTISKVDFYRDGSLLGTDNTSPFSIAWANVPGGKHTIKAIATSSNSKTTESAVINITDGVLPNYTEMWDDFNYASSSDTELTGINKWFIVNGTDGPPSGAIYAKEGITFYNDAQNSGNKIMGIAAIASNDPTKNRHARIETSVMPYRNGTFAARVYFDDTPALYGDANVETFYTINSYATCNNPDLYSEVDFEYLPWDAWQWERKKAMYYTTWETCEIRDHVKSTQSFEGWHNLVYTAIEGQPVKWYVDGQLIGSMDKYQPDSDCNISFANWIYQNTTGSSTTTRTTTMQVDWVYHAKNVALTTQEVLDLVASLRSKGVLRKNLYGDQITGGNVNPAPTVAITSPGNNANFTAPANITINATATDSNGTIVSVSFYNGTTLLGTDTTSPYSYAWTNVAAGSYTVIAKATDNGGAIGSAQINVIVAGNALPVVSITAPMNNASFTAPASVTINATATDSDGTIASVTFYNGTTLLATDASSPYSYVWSSVPIGSYTITTKATDNLGATASATVNVSVINANNSNLALNKAVVVSSTETSAFPGANAVDGNATTRWASLYSDPQWLYVDLGNSYNVNRVKISWEAAYAKNYEVQISANASTWTTLKTITNNTTLMNDNTGLSGAGRYVRIYGTVRATTYGYSIFELEVYGTTGGNQNPVVSITSPANNASFTAPASITINATASDPDGTVASVAFYNGNTLLATDMSSPYSYAWTNVVAGNYAITARATDNLGAVATSATVNVTVAGGNQSPSVSVASPANNSSFTAPASITINATASDADGSIASVSFYNGTTLLNTDASSPFSYTWTSVPVGNYSITARATDNLGAVTISAVVAVSITTSTPVSLRATYQTISTWATGFQGEVRITNNSSTAANGWRVMFDCPHEISPIWDAVTISRIGNRYTIGPAATTQMIPGNSSVVFGFLGIITSGQTFISPTNVSASPVSGRISMDDGEVIDKFTTRNYPNPFADKVNIEFVLPSEDHVLVDVYDITGQRLSVLVNKVLPAGKHLVVWNSELYGTGMFFYRVKSGHHSLTERIVKQK